MAVAPVIAGPAGSNAAIIRRARNRAAIRVEQHLLGIKSQPALRGEGPIYTIAVNLANCDPWHKDMPVVMAAVSNWIQRDRSRGVTVMGLVKQQQLHSSIALRENAEIHAARIRGGTDRKTLTGQNYGVHPP